MKLSVVSTLYKSEPFVAEFVMRTATAAKHFGKFEIILVDDGSPDNSIQAALALQIPQVRILELSRNFGHHSAILAGLASATGELVFLIDSDLEEAPELLDDFAAKLGNNDVVYGVRDQKGLSAFRRFTSAFFWGLISRLAHVKIPPGIAMVRLMKRPYVDALLSMPDRNVFLGGMFAWPGFRQEAVKINRTNRKDPSYSWAARFRLAARAAISFSDWPLYLVFWTGSGISIAAFIYGLAAIINKIANPEAVLDGFTSIMVSMWFLGGLTLGCVGVVGLYIAHVYNQSRARPRYIVRMEHRCE